MPHIRRAELKRTMAFMLAVVPSLVVPGWVLAAPTTADRRHLTQMQPERVSKPLQVTVKRGPQGKKTFVFKKIDLVGKLHRPSVYYLLSRAEVCYDWTRLQEEFLPRIPASVNKAPF